MSEGVPYADIIILALIAGFILLRLRNVLGQRSENEKMDFLERLKPLDPSQEPIIRLADKPLKNRLKEEQDAYISTLSDGPAKTALNAIKEKDASFSATQFLEGAKLAFEMVFDAFAKGDKPMLTRLLAEPIAKEFHAEIDARAGQEKRSETTLVSVVSKEITKASLDKHTAHISVRFVSEQVTVVRDAKGAIIEGNPSETHQVEDEWVFERDVTAKNPNWKIIET